MILAIAAILAIILLVLVYGLYKQINKDLADLYDPMEEQYYERQEKPHVERIKTVIGQRPLGADTPEW